MQEILVSISCTTYNHAPYVQECLEGFLMQKTDFQFEVLVHDDASTDGTIAIIREYEKKYPHIIKPIIQKENQWSQGKRGLNAKYNYSRALGKYIALCEGDDYWTDPLKLQKQVEFLENNPEYVMTYGNAAIEDLTDTYHRKGYYIKSSTTRTITEEKVFGSAIPTLTMVFRNINPIIPKEFTDVMSGDQFLRLFLSRYGKFYYHGEQFGVHRKHPKGVSRTNDKLKWNLNHVYYLEKYLKIAKESQKKHIKGRIIVYLLNAYFLTILNNGKPGDIKLMKRILLNKNLYSRNGMGRLRALVKNVLIKKNDNYLDSF